MDPNRRQHDPLFSQDMADDDQDLSLIWNNLGRLKAELRTIGHRLDDAGEDGLTLPAHYQHQQHQYHHHHHHHHHHHQQQQQHQQHPHRFPASSSPSRGLGVMPGVSSVSDKSGQSTESSQQSPGPGARRKLCRLEDKHNDEDSGQSGKRGSHRNSEPGSRSSARGRETQQQQQRQHGMREDSPKRVDFSRTHQLREVNWDGTYQDSLAFPADLGSSNSGHTSNNVDSTLTSSRDIRETDVRFLNFSRVPHSGGPPPTAHALSSYGANNNALSSVTVAASSSSSATSPPLPPPPPSLSNSATCQRVSGPIPSGSSSSVASTSPSPSAATAATSLGRHQHPHRPHHTQQPADVRWSAATSANATRGTAASGVNSSARSTHHHHHHHNHQQQQPHHNHHHQQQQQ
ncbi:protein naked cuticle, partial [Aplysia californica]|uniref:Protein naked cuticle n=1 Tax=Aplysia californica TaxID=6500 RepID=A0ABM0ZWY9_APLCA